MKFIVIILSIHLFFSQNAKVPKELQSRMISSSEIRFVGLDPNEFKSPKFDFTAYQEIDSVNMNYALRIKTEIKYYYLSPKTIGRKTSFYYNISVKVYNADEDSSLVKTHQKYRDYEFDYRGSDLKKDLFNTVQNSIEFKNLSPARYKIDIQFKDMYTGHFYNQFKEILIRDAEKEEILISDPVFYDGHTRKQLVSLNNSYLNRKDSMIVKFKSFAKDPNASYLLLLRIYRRINDNRFPIRDLIETEKDYYHFTKPWSEFELRLPKSKFDHYEMNLGLKSRIMQKLDITAKKYVSTVSKAELSEDIISADSEKDADLSKDRFSSNVTDVSLENLDYYSEALFTFTWDTIPNTAYEMDQFEPKLKIIFPDSLYDLFADSDFKTKTQIYRDYWKSKSFSGNYIEGLADLYLFKDKIQFAIDNFFRFHNGIGLVVKEPFFEDGWRSEKGILYLKYGLPDEISGENFIDTDGSLTFLRELPVQRWFYYNKNRAFVFLGNKGL